MISPSMTATFDGKPLSVLSELIAKRGEILGETVSHAVKATAITVLKSLRADTRIAPRKASQKSFHISDTGFVGSWERKGGKIRRVVRTSNARNAAKVSIHPVNLAGQRYEKGESVKVFKIMPTHGERMLWNKTRNRGCWYVFAKSEKVAKDLASRLMTRRINSYRGLAKATLGFAMAAVSNNGSIGLNATSAKSIRAAKMAAKVVESGGVSDGSYRISITDALDYSALALKSGAGAVERAMMKAANSIAGRLSKVASTKLGETISTPFPEVKGR